MILGILPQAGNNVKENEVDDHHKDESFPSDCHLELLCHVLANIVPFFSDFNKAKEPYKANYLVQFCDPFEPNKFAEIPGLYGYEHLIEGDGGDQIDEKPRI